eukprot:TRINITY_DN22545_c0_g1_i1.p1 TRINITY_DN22545_c0_g1~~TRINITY_DN22545_c0_g1_i1.p1  ORF type:complete len:481 (+),score=158.51 TRINITY_DN22545_c0_g1_i1:119-1561(+)
MSGETSARSRASRRSTSSKENGIKTASAPSSPMPATQYSVRVKEAFYLDVCRKYSVVPDAAVIGALKTHDTRLKPGRTYGESDLLALVELLLLEHAVPNFHFDFDESVYTSHESDAIASPFTWLDLSDSKIGSNGAILLEKLLSVDSSLTTLNLSNNRIGPRGARALSQALRKNTTLTTLILHGNRLYPKGATALAAGLREGAHQLTYIDLSNNHITFSGVLEINAATTDCNKRRAESDQPLLKVFDESNFITEEILNSITHGIGLAFAICASLFMLYEAWGRSRFHVAGAAIYGFSLVFLYAASTLFHSFFKLGMTKIIFQRLDHAGIYILIAGTYSPLLLVNFHNWTWSPYILGFQWIVALLGTLMDSLWPDNFKLSLLLYVSMGWAGTVMAPVALEYMHWAGAMWILIGGVLYTGGIGCYVLGEKHHPVYHSIWHCFVLAASICHFLCIALYTLPVPLTRSATDPFMHLSEIAPSVL